MNVSELVFPNSRASRLDAPPCARGGRKRTPAVESKPTL
jgi:hypothetical protein